MTESNAPEPPRRPTDLYRFYDSQGTLLYVGISLGAAQRASQHRADKEWWPQVARMDVQHLGNVTRPEAEAIERQAIVDERPKHNVVHNRACVRQAKQPAAGRLEWACELCGEPIADGTGYLEAVLSPLYGGEFRHWWSIHRDCDPQLYGGGYWVGIERIRTIAELDNWNEHLNGKAWMRNTDWDWIYLVARTADGSTIETAVA